MGSIDQGGMMRSVLLVALCCTATMAHADEDRAAAKRHYEEGLKRYNLSDYKLAREEFKAAYLAYPEPSFLYNLGQCSRMIGDYDEEIKDYKAYLRERPHASNREEIEKFIIDAEEQLKRRAADRPPTGTEPPAGLTTTKPAPDATAAKEATPPPATESTSLTRRWWFWTIIAGAVVVVGGAIAIALVATSGKDAPIPMTTVGNGVVTF